MVIGCARLCGAANQDCIRKCDSAVNFYTNQYQLQNRTYPITAVPITRVDESLEITGGDIFTATSSGMQFITTRRGKVYRFLPNPKPGQDVLTEIYEIPESMNLDTMGNKGLYDIAFNKNFVQNPLMYLLFAIDDAPPGYDHTNVIAEYKFNYKTMEIEFKSIVHQLPQKMNQRSGGFMKAGKSKYDTTPAPLWVSSGGNPNGDEQLRKLHPEYSSIYAVYPESIKDANIQHNKEHGNAVRHWSINMKNPIECDYAPLRESDQIYCLNEKYDKEGMHTFTAVQGSVFSQFHGVANADPTLSSSTYTTTTTTTMEERRIVEKIYAPVYQTFSGRSCLPDSLVYSFDNILQSEYRRRVLVAFSPCEYENFRDPRIALLTRSTIRKNWDLIPMPIDFGEELLTDIHLMGTERSKGLFFLATQLRTGYRDIYQLRQTDMYTAETGSVYSTSSGWSTNFQNGKPPK